MGKPTQYGISAIGTDHENKPVQRHYDHLRFNSKLEADNWLRDHPGAKQKWKAKPVKIKERT